MKKTDSIIRYVFFLSCMLSVTMSFPVIFAQPALGAEWLPTAENYNFEHHNFIWLDSNGKAIGAVRFIGELGWRAGGNFDTALFYMHGLYGTSGAIVLVDRPYPFYNLKKMSYQYSASMTESEMDDMDALLKNAITLVRKMRQSNLDLEKPVVVGEIDGKWEGIKVMLEPPKRTDKDVNVFVHFKSKINKKQIIFPIKKSLIHFGWDMPEDQTFLGIRKIVKASLPRIEQFLQERESLKQQLQQ